MFCYRAMTRDEPGGGPVGLEGRGRKGEVLQLASLLPWLQLSDASHPLFNVPSVLFQNLHFLINFFSFFFFLKIPPNFFFFGQHSYLYPELIFFFVHLLI